jgi:hypothetical protein
MEKKRKPSSLDTSCHLTHPVTNSIDCTKAFSKRDCRLR